MRTVFAAGLMLTAASLAGFAAAQAYDPKKPAVETTEPLPAMQTPETPRAAVYPGGPTVVPDGRAMGSDREVASARLAYRSACNEVENSSFCECVTAGVAQALAPAEVRIAARTVEERLGAQGDTGDYASSDATPDAVNSEQRIEQIEGHYADACGEFRSRG